MIGNLVWIFFMKRNLKKFILFYSNSSHLVSLLISHSQDNYQHNTVLQRRPSSNNVSTIQDSWHLTGSCFRLLLIRRLLVTTIYYLIPLIIFSSILIFVHYILIDHFTSLIFWLYIFRFHFSNSIISSTSNSNFQWFLLKPWSSCNSGKHSFNSYCYVNIEYSFILFH